MWELGLLAGVRGSDHRRVIRARYHGTTEGHGLQGAGLRVQGAGFRVQGAGFRVQASGFRESVWG